MPPNLTQDHGFDLIIKNGQVHTYDESLGHRWLNMDVGIRAGKIAALGNLEQSSSPARLNANGLHVIPGAIDTQVHFREPGLTHKEDLATGTRAALKGGITAIFEMPNTKPATVHPQQLQEKMLLAKGRAHCHYSFFIGASSENLSELAHLEELPGVCGVKVFMGSSTGSLLIDKYHELEAVIKTTKRRVALHCEDEERLLLRKAMALEAKSPMAHPLWRDELSALIATKKAVALAEQYAHPVHILHVTTEEEMEYLQHHQKFATVEVTPQHLTLFSPDCYDKLGTLAQMNPPIREKRHQDALWKALNDRVVTVIGSDHAPHLKSEKAAPYPESPSGMPGVQTLLPVMLNHVNKGHLSLERLIELVCMEPARLYKVANKGRIATGYDADLTLIDMNKKWIIEESWLESKCGWSPFTGDSVQGFIPHAIVGGHHALNDGQIMGAFGEPVTFYK